jgi:hypothetical protein
MGSSVTIDDNFESISGGGNVVQFVTSATQHGSIALSNSNGNWDAVYGGGGAIFLDNDQANVIGGGYTIRGFSPNPGPTPSYTCELYGTGYEWDQVNGSNNLIAVNGAQANIIGGNNTVDLVGQTDNIVELYGTNGSLDHVSGTYGLIALNSAQAYVSGAYNTIMFVQPTGNAALLSNTNDGWDTVYGSNGSIGLTLAQANIIGGGEYVQIGGASTVEFYGQTSTYDTTTDYGQGINWDQVIGSGATVALTGAEANVTGGRDTIDAMTSYTLVTVAGGVGFTYVTTPSTVEIYGTNGNADILQADPNSVVALNSSQVDASGDSVTFNMLGGGNTLALSGQNEFLSFAPGFGNATVSGFASTDGVAFSTADFANYQALQAQMSQTGSDVSITGTSGTITFVNETLASLSATQFHFV